MHISSDLAALARDPEMQGQLVELAVALKRQWWASEDGSQLSAALDGIASESQATAAMRQFAKDTGWARRWTDFFVSAQKAMPLMQLPFRHFASNAVHSIAIADTAYVGISLASVDKAALDRVKAKAADEAEIIGFNPGRVLLNFMQGRGELRLFRKGADGDEHCKCRPAGHIAFETGTLLEIDGGTQAFRYGRLDTNILMLRIFIKPQNAALAEEYDAVSERRVFAASADDTETRGQVLMALLRTMERRDAAPVIARQSRIGSRHVRWQALREAIATDTRTGMAELAYMRANDPDPELRAIAERTLAQIERQIA